MEFTATDILTPADRQLSLPVVGRNETMTLYEIPGKQE